MPKTGASRMRQSGLAIGVLIAIGFAIQYLPGQLSPSAPPPVGQPIAAVTMPDPLTARAQSALDRILGPGRSVITASATVGVASNQSSTRFDAKHVAVLSQSKTTAAGYAASVTNNGVSTTTTDSLSPGQVQKLTVSVVIDSTLRPAPQLSAIQRTVSAAMGLQAGRGDQITVIRMPLNHQIK